MSRPYVRDAYRTSGIAYKRESVLTIDNFGGGMNNVEPESTIGDNESPNSKNMMFIANSLMQSRFGTKYVDVNTYTDITEIDDGVPVGVPITWIDEYKPTIGESYFIRATDKEVYINDTKICDVEGKVRGVNFVGNYYFVDGKSLRVYDGENVFKVCSSSSSTTENVAANNNSFKVRSIPEYVTNSNKMHFIFPDGTTKTFDISTLDRETNTITVSSGPPSTILKDSLFYYYVPLDKDTYVEGTEVWDTVSGCVYYEPCENQIMDDFAGANYIPDAPDTIVVHKDRVFIAGDTEQPHGVYLTTPVGISPVYFPVSAGLGVKPDGEKVVDLIVFDNALIVGRHKDMYVLYGNSEYHTMSDDPFYIKKMDVSIGLMSAGCGALLNNYYIYMGYDGRFYRLNTPTTFVEYLMTRPLEWKLSLYNEPFNLLVDDKIEVSAVTYYNEIHFTINSNLNVVYNYDVMGWTYYEGMRNSVLYSDGMHLYIGRDDGKFTMFDKGGENYNDLESPIENVFETKRFDFGASATFKYFTKFMLSSHAWEDLMSYISIVAEIDLRTFIFNEPISSNIPKFGTAMWGRSFFSDRQLFKSGWIPVDFRGRTLKFIFSNNEDNQPFRLYDINVGYTLRDVR